MNMSLTMIPPTDTIVALYFSIQNKELNDVNTKYPALIPSLSPMLPASLLRVDETLLQRVSLSCADILRSHIDKDSRAHRRHQCVTWNVNKITSGQSWKRSSSRAVGKAIVVQTKAGIRHFECVRDRARAVLVFPHRTVDLDLGKNAARYFYGRHIVLEVADFLFEICTNTRIFLSLAGIVLAATEQTLTGTVPTFSCAP